MILNTDYKKAYERQKAAREKAEGLLEDRSRELFNANETLSKAFDDLKNHKEHLVQQEKLASIGLLAAGVAHEINNPIGFIRSNLETLEKYLESIQLVLSAYASIERATHAGSSYCGAIGFARAHKPANQGSRTRLHSRRCRFLYQGESKRHETSGSYSTQPEGFFAHRQRRKNQPEYKSSYR